MLLRYSDDNIRLSPVRRDGRSKPEPLFYVNLEVHTRDYLERFLDTLSQHIRLIYNGGFLPGYVVADPRTSYIVDPNDPDKPAWFVMVPDDNDPRSRVIIRRWKDHNNHLYLDIDLQGECDTPERVAALKGFLFVEVDDEPVPPPDLDGPVYRTRSPRVATPTD